MQDLTTDGACASDLSIDEVLAGEGTALARVELDAHLKQCARCRGRWETVVAERATFLAEVPSFDALLVKVREKRERRIPRSRWSSSGRRGASAAGVAAIAATALLSLRQPHDQASNMARKREYAQRVAVRSKGGPHIGVFVKRDGRVTQGRSGSVVQPGDRLRFTYSSAAPRYLALFNRDGEGTSTYYPSGSLAKRVAAGNRVALGFGVELDEYIGTERVFAVFCEAAFELEPVQAALARGAPPLPDPGCTMSSIELIKEERD